MQEHERMTNHPVGLNETVQRPNHAGQALKLDEPSVGWPVRWSLGLGADLDGPDQLDAVAERVPELESVAAGDRQSVENLRPGRRQPRPPPGDIGNGIRHVRPGRVPLDALLGANMHLAVADLEPEASPPLSDAGFSISWSPSSPQ
jgi:hypothetical protein